MEGRAGFAVGTELRSRGTCGIGARGIGPPKTRKKRRGLGPAADSTGRWRPRGARGTVSDSKKKHVSARRSTSGRQKQHPGQRRIDPSGGGAGPVPLTAKTGGARPGVRGFASLGARRQGSAGQAPRLVFEALPKGRERPPATQRTFGWTAGRSEHGGRPAAGFIGPSGRGNRGGVPTKRASGKTGPGRFSGRCSEPANVVALVGAAGAQRGRNCIDSGRRRKGFAGTGSRRREAGRSPELRPSAFGRAGHATSGDGSGMRRAATRRGSASSVRREGEGPQGRKRRPSGPHFSGFPEGGQYDDEAGVTPLPRGPDVGAIAREEGPPGHASSIRRSGSSMPRIQSWRAGHG